MNENKIVFRNLVIILFIIGSIVERFKYFKVKSSGVNKQRYLQKCFVSIPLFLTSNAAYTL